MAHLTALTTRRLFFRFVQQNSNHQRCVVRRTDGSHLRVTRQSVWRTDVVLVLRSTMCGRLFDPFREISSHRSTLNLYLKYKQDGALWR
jgi:hypothetical protein